MRVVPVSLATVAKEWGRIGILGFGGPPAHVALLRDLTVDQRKWIDAREFEDAFAACNLLPGPASTQMAIYTAQRVGGRAGAIVGGLVLEVLVHSLERSGEARDEHEDGRSAHGERERGEADGHDAHT